jgi:hypothetical protein
MASTATVKTEPEVIAAPPTQPKPFEAQQKRIEVMKEYFANQKKVEIRIRKELGEQWVQINSYAFRIQAGEDVMVPVDVARLLKDADII